MTIKELKEKLDNYNPDLQVKVWKDQHSSEMKDVKYIHYIISPACIVIGQ